MVDEETFRALARSSPWLWSSVRFTRTTVGGEDDERLRAWIQRPARMRVEPERGPVHAVDERDQIGRNRRQVVIGSDGRVVDAPQPEYRFPRDPDAPQPIRRGDGLVVLRPLDFEVVYDDPMYVNYLWVAMLDPRELADGGEPDDMPGESGLARARPDEEGGSGDPDPSQPDVPGDVPLGDADWPPGVEILELDRGMFSDREVLEAVVRPTPDYDPRCACCPLLYSEVSVAIDRAEGAPAREPMPALADRFEVVLDIATGIVVRLRDVGGDRDGEGFDVTIEEVDASYPDGMFRAAPRRRRKRGTGWQPYGGKPQPGTCPW